jgi:hypothetical protein
MKATFHGTGLKHAVPRFFAGIMVIWLMVPRAQATIILFIFTPQGIVIGADSKIRPPGGELTSSRRAAKKLVVLQDRVAVASMSLTGFHLNMVGPLAGQVHTFDYKFESWISSIEKKLPPNVHVSQLAEIVANESKSMLDEFNNLMKSGMVNKEDFPTNIFANFFAVGYENDFVRLYEIDYLIDWEAKKITGPVSKLWTPGDAVWGKFVPPGITTTGEVLKGSGKLYDEAEGLDPVGIHKLVEDREPLTILEAIDAVRVLMKIEAEYVPQAVGPPYVLVTIPPQGKAAVTVLAD